MTSNLSTSSIFIKEEPDKTNERIITSEQMKTLIPFDLCQKEPNVDEKYKIEWRWRILYIKNKKYTEISKREPDSDRVYIDKYGNWRDIIVPSDYDKYVTETYYYYTADE